MRCRSCMGPAICMVCLVGASVRSARGLSEIQTGSRSSSSARGKSKRGQTSETNSWQTWYHKHVSAAYCRLLRQIPSRHGIQSMHQLQVASCSDRFLAEMLSETCISCICRLLRQVPSRQDMRSVYQLHVAGCSDQFLADIVSEACISCKSQAAPTNS